MDNKQKLKGVFERFIKWAEEKKTEYPELQELFDSLTVTSNFDLFCIGLKTSPQFEPLKEICKQADEEIVTSDIKQYIHKKMAENEIYHIDDKDMARLIKYLRLFAEISLNGF